MEYVFGFAFGLLIFQSLFMKDMLGGLYLQAVRHSLLPEWLSMNFMMAGHTTNDNVEVQGAGGLTMLIEVTP